jgi:hypothetical protein
MKWNRYCAYQFYGVIPAKAESSIPRHRWGLLDRPLSRAMTPLFDSIRTKFVLICSKLYSASCATFGINPFRIEQQR